jgi:hypothetical protein
MTTTSKRQKQSFNKQGKKKFRHSRCIHQSICTVTRETSKPVNNNDSHDLVTNHTFIAPYEICAASTVGVLSILMNRHIIDLSFSKLYQQR